MADLAQWPGVQPNDWPGLNLWLSRNTDVLQRGQLTQVRTTSSALTIRDIPAHLVVVVNGDTTLTLPPAVRWKGRIITVKHGAGAATCTVAADGSETIDGASTMAWTTVNEARTFTSDGAAVLRIG